MNYDKRLEVEEALLDWITLGEMIGEVAERLDRAMCDTIMPSFRVERVILYRNKNAAAQNILHVFDAVREKLDDPEEQPVNTREQVLKARENSMIGCCERYADNQSCDCLEEAW